MNEDDSINADAFLAFAFLKGNGSATPQELNVFLRWEHEAQLYEAMRGLVLKGEVLPLLIDGELGFRKAEPAEKAAVLEVRRMLGEAVQ